MYRKREHPQEHCEKCKKLKEEGYEMSCKEYWIRYGKKKLPRVVENELPVSEEDEANINIHRLTSFLVSVLNPVAEANPHNGSLPCNSVTIKRKITELRDKGKTRTA